MPATVAEPPQVRPARLSCLSATCAVPAAELPWFRLAAGIFVACQTMLLGLTINLTAPDDALTVRLLQAGMLAATLVVMGLLGLPLAQDAFAALRQRRLSMELFFLIGALAALAISLLPLLGHPGPVYFEVVNLLLVIYSIGRAIHTHSRERALRAADALAREAATARRICGEAEEIVPVELIRPGDQVRVLPGELIPVDGIVIAGESLVGQAAFTGEWASAIRREGEAVLAAAAAEDGMLLIQATRSGMDRRVDRLAALIRSACQSPTQLQRVADRFVTFFLPLVLLVALGAGTVWALRDSGQRGLFVALSVILVACPCAAGLAAPLTLWQTLGRLARRGLVLRSAEAAERLAQVDLVVLDKTGTLAEQELEVASLHFAAASEALARRLLLAVEQQSQHPVAQALRQIKPPAHGPAIRVCRLRTVPGRGVQARVEIDSQPHTLDLLRVEQADAEHLAIEARLDQRWLATAILQERLRDSALLAVEGFRELGIPVLILTGDASPAIRRAERLAEVEAGVTPEQKLARIEDMAKRGRRVLFVGDGVNDAAAMARCHASVALAHGAEVTIEAACGTLYGGELRLIPEAVQLCRLARATVRANLLFACAYNLAGIAAAAAGWLHPILAAALMSASSAVVGWRALREPSSAAMQRSAKRASAPSALPLTAAPPFSRRLSLLHMAGLVGQVALLIPLAQLEGVKSVAALVAPLALALGLLKACRRCGLWADHFLGMLTLGGLGMNLGWWCDLDLGSAAGTDGAVHTCCALAASLDAARLHHSSHWMYWGMLLLGVPGMLLHRGMARFPARGLVSLGMLAEMAGMCFGMWCGAQLAQGVRGFGAQWQVLISYALMVAGMLAGMAIPHLLEIVLSAPAGEPNDALGRHSEA